MRPFSARRIGEAITSIAGSPSLVVLHPGDQFLPLFVEAVAEGAMTGNLVFDAQIVALLREWGVNRLLTEDTDFGRFKDLEILRL